MSKLTPFADDSASVSIGKLTVENGTDRIALYGSLDITRDRQGLAQARSLQQILDQAVRTLEADASLPETVPPVQAGTVRNPFS